jgi:hypothetical protein
VQRLHACTRAVDRDRERTIISGVPDDSSDHPMQRFSEPVSVSDVASQKSPWFCMQTCTGDVQAVALKLLRLLLEM